MARTSEFRSLHGSERSSISRQDDSLPSNTHSRLFYGEENRLNMPWSPVNTRADGPTHPVSRPPQSARDIVPSHRTTSNVPSSLAPNLSHAGTPQQPESHRSTGTDPSTFTAPSPYSHVPPSHESPACNLPSLTGSDHTLTDSEVSSCEPYDFVTVHDLEHIQNLLPDMEGIPGDGDNASDDVEHAGPVRAPPSTPSSDVRGSTFVVPRAGATPGAEHPNRSIPCLLSGLLPCKVHVDFAAQGNRQRWNAHVVAHFPRPIVSVAVCPMCSTEFKASAEDTALLRGLDHILDAHFLRGQVGIRADRYHPYIRYLWKNRVLDQERYIELNTKTKNPAPSCVNGPLIGAGTREYREHPLRSTFG